MTHLGTRVHLMPKKDGFEVWIDGEYIETWYQPRLKAEALKLLKRLFR